MNSRFDRLSPEEQEFMHKAPILVCILIAGADGEIDRNEIREAIVQAQKRKQNVGEELMLLYRTISEDFEDKLKILVQSYPVEVSQRNPLIVEELSKLNQVLPKLEKSFAIQFYMSICDLAIKVAKSSGGWFGMKAIGEDEAKYVKLPMINDPAAN
ncbi:hypothetical protein WSM22_28160 [Cytophagales bacterium WSM2-2]|nr:hypothetical protein WSM22_28160 [Cytophagales bacterium WSM2-2]